LDTLAGLKTLKVCTGYQVEGRVITEFPASVDVVARCQPVYEELEGWQEDISGTREIAQLPAAAQRYLARLEELTQTPIHIVSVGAQRDQTIIHRNPLVN
jgi:adenylosuccinate synthase